MSKKKKAIISDGLGKTRQDDEKNIKYRERNKALKIMKTKMKRKKK